MADIERDKPTTLTVLLLDGAAWRCHTTAESHPDRRPCGWCVRLPDALVEPLSARYPTEQPTVTEWPTPLRVEWAPLQDAIQLVDSTTGEPLRQRQAAAEPADIDVLRAHQWDHKAKGCACGWHQRNLAPRGMERRNHPEHVAHMLQTRSLLYPPSAEFARRQQ